jgi:hypothetical protein
MAILPDFRLETYLAKWECAARYHITDYPKKSQSLTNPLFKQISALLAVAPACPLVPATVT